jgi:hypothetical protein
MPSGNIWACCSDVRQHACPDLASNGNLSVNSALQTFVGGAADYIGRTASNMPLPPLVITEPHVEIRGGDPGAVNVNLPHGVGPYGVSESVPAVEYIQNRNIVPHPPVAGNFEPIASDGPRERLATQLLVGAALAASMYFLIQ